ncbi:MAG: hypothetical protein LBD10_08155 [Desulfobulbus sp.]|jgi:hypothetical protein|uniref:hypothetical protein n=1 Tax=Desulfobulbus sp. TaxID=895 RepID=UPI0028492EC3|nr:hypothetical protein [Desulfobulbus sp.]MDR2550153.1 hypothetical protein [Desulfobulbus sp.]
METFEKSDLAYEYDWSRYERDDSRISGSPDTTAFNRKEGREMLYLINQLASHLAYGVDGFGNRVEKLLHDHLPTEIRSQHEVMRWLRIHWRSFSVH